MSTYYPSGLLQLHVRLDEGAGPLPKGALDALRGLDTTTYDSGLTALATPSDGLSVITSVQPREVDHQRNGPRFADTLQVSIALRDFPIRAQMIRAVGVVWLAGTVSPDDYQDGMRTAVRGGRTNRALVNPTRENVRFVGFADQIREDESAGELVLVCRDFTSVLLDTEVTSDVLQGIDAGAPLDSVVIELLRRIPGGAAGGLSVSIEPWIGEDGSPLPLPRVASLYHERQTSKAGVSRIPAALASGQLSFWDLITDLCMRAGMVPMIEEDALRIVPPRNVFGSNGSWRRTVAGETLTVRRMVLGNNLRSLQFSRDLGRLASPAVVVRSWAPGLSVPLEARWPEAVKASQVLPSGLGASEKPQVLLVRGVTDPAQLSRIARSLYEEMSRTEYGGTLSTVDLASLGGGNSDPDLLDLRSGDPLEVVIQNGGQRTGLSWVSRQTSDEAFRRMRAHGIAAPVARALVRLAEQTRGLQTVFRVRECAYKWRLSGPNPSVQVDIGFANWLEVRENMSGSDTR